MRRIGLVLEWASQNRRELFANWERARERKPLVPIEPLRRDTRLFRSVRVDPELGTIVWPNGADICPDTLFLGLGPVDPAAC